MIKLNYRSINLSYFNEIGDSIHLEISKLIELISLHSRYTEILKSSHVAMNLCLDPLRSYPYMIFMIYLTPLLGLLDILATYSLLSNCLAQIFVRNRAISETKLESRIRVRAVMFMGFKHVGLNSTDFYRSGRYKSLHFGESYDLLNFSCNWIDILENNLQEKRKYFGAKIM